MTGPGVVPPTPSASSGLPGTLLFFDFGQFADIFGKNVCLIPCREYWSTRCTVRQWLLPAGTERVIYAETDGWKNADALGNTAKQASGEADLPASACGMSGFEAPWHRPPIQGS